MRDRLNSDDAPRLIGGADPLQADDLTVDNHLRAHHWRNCPTKILGLGRTEIADDPFLAEHRVGEALQVKGVVSSPSYIIQNEYDGAAEGHPARLLHMDCWRLEAVDPEVLGLASYLVPGTVAVIEWAGALLPYLAAQPGLVGYRILIEHTGETSRVIKVASL